MGVSYPPKLDFYIRRVIRDHLTSIFNRLVNVGVDPELSTSVLNGTLNGIPQLSDSG